MKSEITYELELCSCMSYINLRREWSDSNGKHSKMIGSYSSAKICVSKAKTDFFYCFNEERCKLSIRCKCWDSIHVRMRDVSIEEIDYAG